MTRFTPLRLSARGLFYYWRTNAAVLVGVAAAVAVLTGALLVGDSVRGSLQDLVLQRLGKTSHVVSSTGFFREQLAGDMQAGVDGACPILVLPGFVSLQSGSARAGGVVVYGVDARFWKFHGLPAGQPLSNREALVSPALARELRAQTGSSILVRVQRPSDVPVESLHGRKEDLGKSILATVHSVLEVDSLGEFSLQPSQGEVRAVFLSLSRLQQDLSLEGRVNTVLVTVNRLDATAEVERLVRSHATLEDIGLKLRTLEGRNAISLEAQGGLITDAQATAAMGVFNSMGLRPEPVFTYLANGLRANDRAIPYSLVSAMDIPQIAPDPSAAGPPSILLNAWAARELQAGKGSRVTMDYYAWEEPGRLVTHSAEFTVADVVPIDPRDRDLAPTYPGISESTSLASWDPPFPIDLRTIRPADEEYWKLYRTTPKAFLHFGVGFQLWKSRYGSATSFRVTPEKSSEGLVQEIHGQLRSKLDPLAMGLSVRNVREQGIQSSRGATNFAEYFVYFSFFLVVSALLLASLFFKLSVEQRAREVGLLRAVGLKHSLIQRLFLSEGLLIAIAGAILGAPAGVAYGYLIVAALRTFWIDAVGTTAINLHISQISVAAGALSGITAAVGCLWFTLRSLRKVSERTLLSGQLAPPAAESRNRRAALLAGIAAGASGLALGFAGWSSLIDQTGAFFGAGSALLVACLCFFSYGLRSRERSPIEGQGWWPVSRLGLRGATYRPARSVLSIAMIASATFILISVDAFRKDGVPDSGPQSGVGGYSLLVESLLPIIQDPRSREVQASLGLSGLDNVKIEPFRMRPGDDTSCLDLYEPANPKILAPTLEFIAAGRFGFHSSLASGEGEKNDPWLLLLRQESDGAVPVIADANSMAYVLHRKLGEDLVIKVNGRPVHLRLVAALRDSIFQSELLMSQENFLKLFPEQEGYPFLLIETQSEQAPQVAALIEEGLKDFGADATPTLQRLASFHRVENTYLSTFQMLGGLGLVLGTVGLGAVLLRNVFERRRELALLRALGYRPAHFLVMIMAENLLLLVGGLLTGLVCSLVSILPVLLERGGHLPALGLSGLLGGILVSGLITSGAATAVALRSALLPALKSE